MALREKILEVTSAITSVNSSVSNLRYCDSIAAICNVDVTTPSADTFVSGVAEVQTITFDTQANTGDADYVVVYDTTGQAWAVAADKTGASAEPTGAIWTAIAAANKAQADISGDTTAAQVAATFEAAFDGISGFTAVITSDDTAADGTMTMTNVVRGVVSDGVVKNATDAGAGSISIANTTQGVDSDTDTSTEYVTLTSHDLTTGLKGQLTTDGTLPAGLSTGTDYFIIVVDANTVQFATSLANALAGTAINITDQGASGNTHTFTPTTAAGSCQIEVSNDNTNWLAIGSADSFNADEVILLEDADVGYRYARVALVITAGRADVTIIMSGKERKV